MIVSRDVVMEGIIRYTIEAKLMLQEALSLFRQDRFAGAVILGTLTIEHLGQAHWLIEIVNDDARRDAFTSKSLAKELKSTRHLDKLKRGLRGFSATMPSIREELGTLQEGTAEYTKVLEDWSGRIRTLHKRHPDKLYRDRTTAQYPELDIAGVSWRTSSEITREIAANTLLQAGNNLCAAQMWSIKPVEGLRELAHQLGLEDGMFENVDHGGL
jgi:AbiV family abortive infection protein